MLEKGRVLTVIAWEKLLCVEIAVARILNLSLTFLARVLQLLVYTVCRKESTS